MLQEKIFIEKLLFFIIHYLNRDSGEIYLIDSNEAGVNFNRSLLITCSACLSIGPIAYILRALVPIIIIVGALSALLFSMVTESKKQKSLIGAVVIIIAMG